LGGRAGFPTKVGTFKVTRHHKDHVSSQFNAPMPWAVFFNKGAAFHQGSLGVESHGCVHLGPSDAERVFNFLKDGDQVEVVP
jgi:lipoprotein-anchoring transpeptidase ErfK/SrfK